MQKQSTKKKAQKASATVKAERRAQLARDLAAIMANPETPVALHDAISGALGDMSSDIDYYTPEMIKSTLAAYERKEAKRKGGAGR